MSDVMSEIEAQYTNSNRSLQLAYGEPALAAARISPEPQPMYAEFHRSCPVRPLGEEHYAIYSMEDVLFLNKHQDVAQGSRFLGGTSPAIPLGLDGDEHRKYRRLLDPVFALRRIAGLEPQVRRLAGELIDGFIGSGAVDAYQQWCEPLPSTIFLSIMGLPMADRDRFIEFKNRILGTDDPLLTQDQVMARRMEAVAWIQAYFTDDLDRREGQPPSDDMIGWLATTEVDGERLNRDDLLAILGLLMIAGLDTVAASLGCFLAYFAAHPEERAQAVRDPSLWPSAVAELLRFESPVTEGHRRVLADVTLPSGVVLPAGSWLTISWSGANLDPHTFADPLTVDLRREVNPHIAFASGFHRCLGSHLARMELCAALEVWHARIPDYAVAEGVALSYSGNPRAPKHLPLVW